jgi:hypothetical protein
MKKELRFSAIIILGILILSFGIISKSGSEEKADIKALFEQKYTAWQTFMNSPKKKILSDLTGTSTQYYKDIIDLGIPALPYIIEKMKQDSDLWVAFFEITKKRFSIEERKNNKIYDLYLTWWNEGYKQTKNSTTNGEVLINKKKKKKQK